MQDKAEAALQDAFNRQGEDEQHRQPAGGERAGAAVQVQQQTDGVNIDGQRRRAEGVNSQPLPEQPQGGGQRQQSESKPALL